MDKTDIAEFKALYLQTAKEYIEAMKKNILLNSDEAINAVYMSAHSLKSQSLVMNYKETGMLCGMLEKVGKGLKEQTLQLTPEIAEGVKNGIEKVAVSVTSIETTDQEVPTAEEISHLESASGISLSQ